LRYSALVRFNSVPYSTAEKFRTWCLNAGVTSELVDWSSDECGGTLGDIWNADAYERAVTIANIPVTSASAALTNGGSTVTSLGKLPGGACCM
jgi:hypothetical protein